LLSGSFHNYGFIIFPLALSMFGAKAMSYAFAFAVTCDALFWSYGVYLINSEKFSEVPIKEVISPPFLAVLFSITLVATGVSPNVPVFLLDILYYPAKIAIPVALICIGGVFYYSFSGIKKENLHLRELGINYGFRHLIFPVIWVLLASMLPVSELTKKIFYLEAIMPASVGIVVMVALYEGDEKFTVFFSTTSNLFAVATIPVGWLIIERLFL